MSNLSTLDEMPEQQSLLALLCQSDKYYPDIDPTERFAVTRECDGSAKGIIDCNDKSLEMEILAVGGLGMMSKELLPLTGVVSQDIPIVPRDMFRKPPDSVSHRIVGIMLKDALTKQPYRDGAGQYRSPAEIMFNKDILSSPVFEGKRVILFSVSIDSLLEPFWWRRKQNNLIKDIADTGFYAVTGANFSVFAGECPVGHALNINKSLLYCEELSEMGVYVIPHVYAINNSQRKRWGAYLTAHPEIKTITINTQLQSKRERDMYVVARTVRYLLSNTEVSIILHGSERTIPSDLIDNPRVFSATSGKLKKAIITKRCIEGEVLEGYEQGNGFEIDGTYRPLPAR